MNIPQRIHPLLQTAIAVWLLSTLFSCSSTYYGILEKAGIHKRDLLVDRVEEARDSQAEAQEQFQSALEQFNAVVSLQETDLKIAYEFSSLQGKIQSLIAEMHRSIEASNAFIADLQ